MRALSAEFESLSQVSPWISLGSSNYSPHWQLLRNLNFILVDAVAPYLLGATTLLQLETIHEALEPLSSAACNAHLVMLIFDTVLLTLFPEMGIESLNVMPDMAEQPTIGGSEDTNGGTDSIGDDNDNDGTASMLPDSDNDGTGSIGGIEPNVVPLTVL